MKNGRKITSVVAATGIAGAGLVGMATAAQASVLDREQKRFVFVYQLSRRSVYINKGCAQDFVALDDRIEALERLGVTAIHRRSYAPVRRLLDGSPG